MKKGFTLSYKSVFSSIMQTCFPLHSQSKSAHSSLCLENSHVTAFLSRADRSRLPASARFRSGFTLVEILIVLSILGAVSAIVIPSVVNNTNDSELKNMLRKTYADLAIATKKIADDNGGTLDSFCGTINHINQGPPGGFDICAGQDGNYSNSNELKDAYKGYLNYAKSCDKDVSAGNCWITGRKWLNKTGGWDAPNSAQLVLNNGAYVDISYSGTVDSNSHTPNCAITNSCGTMIIDVNGARSPNIQGRDVYYFTITGDGLIPMNDNFGCDPKGDWNTGGMGTSCVIKILKGEDY